MTSKLLAYNFLAEIFKWPSKLSAAEVDSDNFKNRIPKKTDYYNIDTKKYIAELFYFFKGAYLVKVADGRVSEFYVSSNPAYPNASYVSLNIQTREVIEYYTFKNNIEQKYDVKTDMLMQTNYVCSFYTMPIDFQKDMDSFDRKNAIVWYARKPYGRIVEIM